MLDRSPVGVLILDEQRRVVYTNRTIEQMSADRDGICLAPEGIVLMHRQDNARLKELIGCAMSPIPSPRGRGAVMRARRPTGRRSYGIMVSPVSGTALSILSPRSSVCVVVTDPESSRLLPLEALRGAFGLTPSEARLAALIAAGQDLRSAAEQLRITYGTARVRLAGIFEKTETRRQGELVKILLATLTAL
jgi:DNA-binding CsgD family transcriptional regulator